MCEYCVVSESWGEPLEKGGAVLKCEWMPDPEETLLDSMDPDDASESQLRDLQTLAEDQTEISRLTLRLTETARQP